MLLDSFDRPLVSLRVSVTDRCNLRCLYCMPEENYRWLDRDNLLTFEEITRIVSIAQRLGVERVRITGGEPLLRRDLPRLIRQLAALPLKDLSMTSNGLLLADQARELRAAGLRRVTISLDSLRPATFLRLAQRGSLEAVLQGLEAARRLDFTQIKINTILMRGVNDGEILDLLNYAGDLGLELRFIEYMDVGGATGWNPQRVVSRAEILQWVGPVTPMPGGTGPAERFRRTNGQVFGIIASVTQPFCRHCDRARLTADGHFLQCLYAREGLDLLQPVRSGQNDESLQKLLAHSWRQRHDREAEARAALPACVRASFVSLEDLQRDPRLEMHTRGG